MSFENINIDNPRIGTTNAWRDSNVHPVISPSGQLINVFVDKRHGANAKLGQAPIVLAAGQAVIHPKFAELGFVLYKDLCEGRVPDVEAAPKHWGIWTRYVEALAAGKVPAPGSIPAEKFYHPEVLRRRANSGDGGLALMTESELAAMFGFDVDGEIDPDDIMGDD